MLLIYPDIAFVKYKWHRVGEMSLKIANNNAGIHQLDS